MEENTSDSEELGQAVEVGRQEWHLERKEKKIQMYHL